MESQQLQYRRSVVHYRKWGNGTRYLCCLHGYGESGQHFGFLANVLGSDYTIIALDLPFHGSTNWQEGLDFTAESLYEVINQIVPLSLQTISLLGYSMGGRLCMAFYQHYPQVVERVVLVAPDGLHKNPWYWLATQTSWGNRLFHYTMYHPQWFFRLMQLFRRVQILNKSIFRFAHHYLDNPAERHALYQRWTTMRRFIPKNQLLIRQIQSYHTPVRMLFGKYDRIIRSNRARQIDRAHDTVSVITIPAGHQLLKEKYAATIARLFYE